MRTRFFITLALVPTILFCGFFPVVVYNGNSLDKANRESMRWHETCLTKQKKIQDLKDQITFLEVDEMFHIKTSDEVAEGIMKLKLEIAALYE